MRKLLEGFRSVDRDAAIALVYTAVNLSVIEFWFLSRKVFTRLLERDGARVPGQGLEAGATWAVATTVLQLVVPLFLIRFVHKRRIRDHGWRLQGLTKHVWIYLGLFLCMVPVLLWVATRPEFLMRYPFVREARTDFGVLVRWELFYVLQFFALESFFRGYLLFTLERALKWNAIFVMVVPYCVIHWHKPPLECFAAIGAGVLLGGLALRFRSWYGGAILHSLVAVAMDSLAYMKAN